MVNELACPDCEVTVAERIAALEQMRLELVALAAQARRGPARADAAFCHIIEDAPRP